MVYQAAGVEGLLGVWKRRKGQLGWFRCRSTGMWCTCSWVCTPGNRCNQKGPCGGNNTENGVSALMTAPHLQEPRRQLLHAEAQCGTAQGPAGGQAAAGAGGGVGRSGRHRAGEHLPAWGMEGVK